MLLLACFQQQRAAAEEVMVVGAAARAASAPLRLHAQALRPGALAGAPPGAPAAVPGPGAGPGAARPSLLSWDVSPSGGEPGDARTVGGAARPECQDGHSADEAKPLPQVAFEWPGEDLWCHFGYLGPWVSLCARAHRERNYAVFANGLNYSAHLPRNGTMVTVRYDGGTFLSQNNIFLYDDFYCHANRWLRGQGLPLALRENYTAWAAFASARQCADLRGRFPLEDLSITDLLRRTGREMKMLEANVRGSGSAPTVLDMQRHAAVKCALGDIGCDMAYCQNWCLRDDGTIGRDEFECGPIAHR